MKAWLKGLLIGLSLFIIYFIGVVIFFCSGGPFGGTQCTFGNFLKLIPETFVNTGVVLVLIALVLLGALIGWIIEKIKSKK